MKPRPPAPDQDQRDLAIRARGTNVLVDAGAGTGKTTILVARLVELVAPRDDGAALELSRIAAITFTRKAAGELRFRIREALLAALAPPDLTTVRRRRLAAALGTLDTAHVGTIHGFADRLLRLRPVEAGIGPEVEIVEDESELVHEAVTLLLQASESGTLGDELAGWCAPADAKVAAAAIDAALTAHLRVETKDLGWSQKEGLEALFGAFISSRDVTPALAPPPKANLAAFRRYADEFLRLAKPVKGGGAGSRWFRDAARAMQPLLEEGDPAVIVRELGRALRHPDSMRKSVELVDDPEGWDAWKAFDGDERKTPVRDSPLRDDLVGPLHRWLAGRLVAARPAVLAAYEKVKARRRAVDQLDLLLKLRDLLRDDMDVRREAQALFDHLFVDEFQDTDPLQAEVVLFLAEDGARAKAWDEVVVAPGRLTLVGDPKQSIYRFRRADVATYAAVRAIVERGPCEKVSLSANFRCLPGIVSFVNHRFDEILGTTEGGKPVFNEEQGTVANEPLLAGRAGAAAGRVAVLPIQRGEKEKVDVTRANEARALASWLRWTVEGQRREIVDPVTRETRPAGYGDVAILAASTYGADVLFEELDRQAIPCAARGGVLFLSDPLHRRFLLALRAIADRDDGVAQSALLRPPLFALELADLARERAASAPGAEEPEDEAIRRIRAARALVVELRRRRLERSPGATARDLLERTALGRVVALGPNGAQRLARLRELCHQLDAIAVAEGLDYDAVTARVREWALEPVQLDPPRPVASAAVQFLTIHQAKGLEFPIVVVWDACRRWDGRDQRRTWAVERDGAAWTLAIDGLEWEEPAEAGLAEREQRYLAAERRRLAYVATTRARDLLVLPVAAPGDGAFVKTTLTARAPPELLDVLPPFDPAEPPEWGAVEPAGEPGEPGDADALFDDVSARWEATTSDAARPRFAPAAVSGEAHRIVEERDEEAGAVRAHRPGRFGAVFGETVHLAIGAALREPSLSPAEAVARAARLTSLDEYATDAAEDVARALQALTDAGLRRAPGADLQLEYPVAFASEGKLLTGYVDLLAAAADGVVTVIDFKTDAPPEGDVYETHPAYVEQVRSYGRILKELGVAREVKGGLLFTATGTIHWA
ncbi:exodeoxyribonuclease V subunit beta [Anaeromyxobacter sp. SG66]|uniref:UvrD-helicase domain-containing protein n=1 Tax=Anaeromyxobacter sp. SG66 TaxID=2925410 RepID=UPI001F57F269|nr:UvrD-helicase domain-containing protein [Anaeromyxobacter sp. SG66]